MPKLQACTKRDDEDDDSSDDDDSSYNPEDGDNDSIADTNTNTAGVYDDTTAGVIQQADKEQNNEENEESEYDEQDNNNEQDDNDEQNENNGVDADITGVTASNDETITARGNNPITYDSEPGHKNEDDKPLETETSNGTKKVKIKMLTTIIQENQREMDNENNMNAWYGPKKREGLQPRKCRNTVSNKFREHAHTMFQIGENFPAYAQV